MTELMLPLDQAGARHSQSPIVANGGAVIEPAYPLVPCMLVNIAQFQKLGFFATMTIRAVPQRMAQKMRAALKPPFCCNSPGEFV